MIGPSSKSTSLFISNQDYNGKEKGCSKKESCSKEKSYKKSSKEEDNKKEKIVFHSPH